MASVAFKYVPQTAATTFAFTSVCFFFYMVPGIGLSSSILGHAGCLRFRLGSTPLPLSPSAEAVALRLTHVHAMRGPRGD